MKLRSKIWLGVGVLAIVVLLLTYSFSLTGNVVNEKEGEFKIGIILPLSGNAAYYGQVSKNGAETALSVINEDFPNLDLELIYEDSQFLSQEGVSAYTKLRNVNKIDAVITGASHISLAVKPLAEQDRILQMAVFSAADSFSSSNDLSFRLNSKSEVDSVEIAKFIGENGFERVGIIYLQNDFGVAYKDTLKQQLLEHRVNSEVVIEENFLLTDTDFRSILTKIESKDPDLIFMVGLASNYAHIMNQAKELDVDSQFLTMWSAEDPVLISIAGDSAEDLIYSYPFDATSTNSETVRFVKKFENKYGSVPDAYASQNYEALRLTASAFLECGKDYDCIRNYLKDLEGYNSVFGSLSFDEDGDMLNDFFMKTVRDGEFVPLQ